MSPTIVAETAPVTRKTIVDELVVRGTVVAVPNEDVKVSALVPGRVNAVTVAEGDSVRQGQVIAELDRQPLEDQRRQAAAGVDQAKAQVENARLALQRNQQLFERGIAAGKEVEDAKKEQAAAQAALEQANAALSIATRNVERAASGRRSPARSSNGWSASVNRWTARRAADRGNREPRSRRSWPPTSPPTICRA
jgi:multidrug efflux pump subunit AcrA (membrane-fusion protein)